MAFGKKKDKAQDDEKAQKKADKKAEKQAKKQQKKEEKKKKKDGEQTEEGGGKKKSKKKLLLILLAVAALGIGFRLGLLDRFTGGGGAQKQALPDAVEAYELDGESVASLTAAFEGVGDELLVSVAGNGLPVAEDAEDAEDADAEDADKADKQEADVAEEALHSNYYYKITADTEDDLAKYAEYLTAAGEEGAGFTLRTSGSEAEYVTAYEKDAAEHTKQLVILEIENPLNGDPETGMFAIKLHLEEKQEKLKEGVTRDQAMQYFMGLDYQTLGLEKPISDYYIVMDMGRTYIDKNDCYGINLYNKGDGEESYFVKKFYLSLEQKKLYEYLAGDLVGLQENYTMNHLVSSNQTDTDMNGLLNQSSTPAS